MSFASGNENNPILGGIVIVSGCGGVSNSFGCDCGSGYATRCSLSLASLRVLLFLKMCPNSLI
jgi:hypothetical protein